MKTALSSPPLEDIDATMLRVARDIAQDIYPIETILSARGISGDQYEAFKRHPRFQGYVISEREAWLSAGNIEGRTKLKAGIVLEMFMDNAYTEMSNKVNPLNQRVDLGRMLAKIAGFGEPKVFAQNGSGGGSPGFLLQINIGPGVEGGTRRETINIQPEVALLPDREWSDKDWGQVAVLERGWGEGDDYKLFSSPDTLADMEEDE